MVNMEKSSILFSANTSDEEKEAAMNVLNIHRSLENDRYLGLPYSKEKTEAMSFNPSKREYGHKPNAGVVNSFLVQRSPSCFNQ